MGAVGPVGDEVVEGGRELHGRRRGLFDLRQHVRRRRVLVAGLHGRIQLVQGVVDALHPALQDGVCASQSSPRRSSALTDDVVDLLDVVEEHDIDLPVERVVRVLARLRSIRSASMRA